MSVLVVGLSHKSASLPVLERAVVSGDTLSKLIRDVSQAPNVGGTFVVSTCNRVEVYAEVDKFHGGVSSICDLLARHSSIPLSELTPNLYVHYEDRAVQHLLAVACGLESMVVGETQILGQVRQALSAAREHGTLSRGLGELGTLALRTAKRAHTETRIDHAGANLVSIGIAVAHGRLATGPARRRPRPGPGRSRPAICPSRSPGCGCWSSGPLDELAGRHHRGPDGRGAHRGGQPHRRPGGRLAASVGGSVADLADLAGPIAEADLVISCTGAAGVVISADLVTAALARRARPAGPWSCWTWPCPVTSIRPWPGCRGFSWSGWTRWGTGPRGRRGAGTGRAGHPGRGRGCGPGHRRRGVRGPGVGRARGPGGAHRGRAADQGGQGGGRRAGPAGWPAARRPPDAGRGRTGHAPGRGQVAARTDGAGQGAGRVPGR